MKNSKNNLIFSTSSTISKEILHNSVFSNELQRLNMTIYEMSYSILDHNWRKGGLFVPFSRIYFVCSGSADIFCNGKCTTITAGNAYILPADSEYAFCCHDNLEKFYFHFNVYQYGNIDIFSSVKNIITLENRSEEIKFLQKNWKRDNLFSVLQTKSILYRVVCDALEKAEISLGSINSYSPVVKKTLDFINENLNANLKLHQIADHLFLSESYISKCFKAECGRSVKNYITDQILSAAAISLRHSNLTIKEISNSYGFCDQFYFSRIFTAKYGVSPKIYRDLDSRRF